MRVKKKTANKTFAERDSNKEDYDALVVELFALRELKHKSVLVDVTRGDYIVSVKYSTSFSRG